MQNSHPTLNRTLSLTKMVFYGLGTIVGAGIYVLIGEISGLAGAWAPLSFLLAALIASLTGLSYAELVSRHPRSAGEAAYVQAAFKRRWMSQLIGWAVVLTGLVSAATLMKGFSGYFLALLGGDSQWVITIALIAMCILACSGVKQSVGVAVLITVVELVGLLLVLLASSDALVVESNWQRWREGLVEPSWVGISAATLLAFYAFIGFEDMVNMAEEVKDAERVLPRAIVIAIVASSAIYVLIAMVAVVVMPLDILSASKAPMATIVEQSAWFPSPVLTAISLVAILNGAIVQLLMAPRVIYGLTKESKVFSKLGAINVRTRTPVNATIFVSLLILLFALALPLAELAKLTSILILMIFIVVNLSLIFLKKNAVFDGFTVPLFIPILGVLTSFILLFSAFVGV